MQLPVITLTTDFGAADGFPAAMKGVILTARPDARVVDVTHDVPPGDVAHASFVLGAIAPAFPPGTVHVAVVDPGVGTARRALAIGAPDGARLVGPDNGVFTHLISASAPFGSASHERPFLAPAPSALPDGFSAFVVENPLLAQPVVSRTFHGRDVFAAVAAQAAGGLELSKFGPPAAEIAALNLPGPRREGGRLVGRIQHIDRFGNLATDIDGALVAGGLATLQIAGTSICGLSEAYASARGVGCIIASHGFIEVFVTGGSASERLGARVGDEVAVVARDSPRSRAGR